MQAYVVQDDRLAGGGARDAEHVDRLLAAHHSDGRRPLACRGTDRTRQREGAIAKEAREDEHGAVGREARLDVEVQLRGGHVGPEGCKFGPLSPDSVGGVVRGTHEA